MRSPCGMGRTPSAPGHRQHRRIPPTLLFLSWLCSAVQPGDRKTCTREDSCLQEGKWAVPKIPCMASRYLLRESGWEGNSLLGWGGVTKGNVLIRGQILCFSVSAFLSNCAFSPSEYRVNSCAEPKKNLIWCSFCVYLCLKGRESYWPPDLLVDVIF